MARSSKSVSGALKKFFKRIFVPPFVELSRTGKILQTLWDASQLQSQQRDSYRKIGEIAAQLVKDGKLENIKIARMLAKIEQAERILQRQEHLLRSYQARGDLREILGASGSSSPVAVGDEDEVGMELNQLSSPNEDGGNLAADSGAAMGSAEREVAAGGATSTTITNKNS